MANLTNNIVTCVLYTGLTLMGLLAYVIITVG
nr:MAG TPA: hypothetical protein [Caudoviricetes sp.]